MPTRTASSSLCWRGSSISRIGLVQPVLKQRPPFLFFNGGTLVYLNNSKDHRFWQITHFQRTEKCARERETTLLAATVFNVYLPFLRLAVQFGLYIFLCSDWRLVVIQICIRKTNVALKWLQIYIDWYIYWYILIYINIYILILRNLYEDWGLSGPCNPLLLLPSEHQHTFDSISPFILVCFYDISKFKQRLSESYCSFCFLLTSLENLKL